MRISMTASKGCSTKEVMDMATITLTEKNFDTVMDYLASKVPYEVHKHVAPDGKTVAETGCSCGVYWHQNENGGYFWQYKCFCGLGD